MNNKVRGFDGRTYPWTLIGYTVAENDTRPRSSYHLRCRELLHDIFPTSPICEEVLLPGSGNLRLDFYLPRQRLGVEVHGEQHYKMKSKFHNNKKAFIASQRRDTDKAKWCELNNIRLVILSYIDESEKWRRQITDG